jgi:hypothetical protein
MAVALIGTLILVSCRSPRHSSPVAPTVIETADAKPSVSEIPSDSRLAIAVGVMMRNLEVRYPSSMKLSVTIRVYRDGILDSGRSSRQVHGTTLAMGNQYLSLGWLDPDVTSPEPRGKLKIFGSGIEIWINKPSENFGGFIDVPKTGELPPAKSQLVMELAYGSSTPHSSSGIGPADIREGAIVRITVHVLVEPLSKEERELLKKQSNFNKAFKVDE